MFTGLREDVRNLLSKRISGSFIYGFDFPVYSTKSEPRKSLAERFLGFLI